MQSEQQNWDAGDDRQHQACNPDADTNYTANGEQNAFDSIFHIQNTKTFRERPGCSQPWLSRKVSIMRTLLPRNLRKTDSSAPRLR